jgi:hypothetical protein
MTDRAAPPPLFPIHTDSEARAMLHGAGAIVGERSLWVVVPPTTPLMDLICAGQRLGYSLAPKPGPIFGGRYMLTMEKTP